MNKIFSGALIASTVFFGGVAHATPSLGFIVDGDTFTSLYSITNNSTAGETVLRFNLNLSTAVNGGPYCFDTVNGGPCNPNVQTPTPFFPINGATTGLVSPSSVADGSQVLDLVFNNLGAGETFSWNIDIDSSTAVTTFGNDLIGASAFVDFSNGQRLFGSLFAVAGNPDAAQFTVTGTAPISDVPEPGTLALMALAGLGLVKRKRS